MSTSASAGASVAAPVPVNGNKPTVEQAIDTAALQASQIVAGFSPAISTLIQAGVAVEPVVSGMVQIIAGLFKHHAKQAVKS